MKSPNKCPIHQCQKTFLHDVKISTNKLQFHHEIMKTERDIWIQVYMHTRVLCDIWLYGICDKWLHWHRVIWTEMAILKVRLNIIAAGLYDTWRRNEWAEINLPPGWVLQGMSELGMPSLSLLQENELATALCGSILYPKHMSPSFKNSSYETLHFR